MKHDRIKVTVVNNLENEETAIHWHGFLQKGTPWYDGAPGTTQCPIAIGKNFTYNIKARDSGTFWWHSHFIGQYVDGLAGALIVHDPKDPYLPLYDEEFIVYLADWYHQESSELLHALKTPVSEGGEEPVAQSLLINGKNRFNCTYAPKESKCNSNVSLAKFRFEKDKRYRIRIINSSADHTFYYSIDNHHLLVIEADSQLVKLQKVHSLRIEPGQRYSAIVNADQAVDSFWMRATVDADEDASKIGLKPEVKAVVQYAEAPNKNPQSKSWKKAVKKVKTLQQKHLRPYRHHSVPGPVGRELIFKIDFREDEETNVLNGFINNSTGHIDIKNPILNKVLHGYSVDAITQTTTNVFVFDKFGEVIQIVIQNQMDEDHPFHLHGHNFYWLGSGPNPYNPANSTLNLKNPPLRDTSNVPASGWTVIRFVANNPGAWFLHCHIEWHVQQGMLVQFLELPLQLKEYRQPEAVTNLCDPSFDDLASKQLNATS
ncbi:hypothetical protein G9A89_009180 [Geosiphon pyriformis]|nr:hypothetical protein G9A89_009180 [Geosiphon pyriformis]